MAHSNETQGDLMRPFLTVQMSKLNGLGKTHRECIFVVELNLKLCSFTTNKLFEKIQVLNEWKFHRLFSKIPSVSVVQFTVQMFKLNGLGKTHQERIFVVELKLRSLFHCELIAWENSGNKWMKVPSFSFIVTKYLTF